MFVRNENIVHLVKIKPQRAALRLCAFVAKTFFNWSAEIFLPLRHNVTKNIYFKILLAVCSFIYSFNFSLAIAQQKYYIYLKDKGITSNESLNKFSSYYEKALGTLSERSIQRRIKNLGEDKIIIYEDLPILQSYVDVIISHGIKIENKLTWFNAVTAYLVDYQKNILATLPFVDRIEPVKTYRFKQKEFVTIENPLNETSTNNQTDYGPSFTQLNLSDIPKVHAKGINGDKVIIGVLDTGFKWKAHESLVHLNVLGEYDFVFKDSITADEADDRPGQHNHGTSVLSVIGGYKDSMLIGAASGSSFILAKTEDIRSETHVEEDNYAAALIWMESLGVDITTSSLGYNEFDDSVFSYKYSDMDGQTTIVTKAAELAFQRGVVTITAAGNEGNTSWFRIIAPADGFNTIAVGAVNQNNVLASFSSRGPSFDGRVKPEIAAQGVNVFCANAFSFNSYGYGNGTSLATPIAAGVASLLISAHPHLKNTQVRNILIETADNSKSPNNEIGYGLISASKAISFPNLELVNESYVLHKTFFSGNGVDTNQVKVLYSINVKDYDTLTMIYDGVRNFTKEFPQMVNNQIVNFYFLFNDTSGNTIREPAANFTYKFKYGDMNVYQNLTPPIPYDYGLLSQNYPNPFNLKTWIKFISPTVEHADLVIIDAIGQKVKTLFNGLTKAGENIVQWDGLTDQGTSAASGVYLYILKIGGKEYGKKMVLLK